MPTRRTGKKVAADARPKRTRSEKAKGTAQVARERSESVSQGRRTPPLASPRDAAPADPAPSKPKLVRDSFTIPKSEYAVLAALKVRAANLARPVKKSELLRAGIAALQAMSNKAFLASLGAVPVLKTGRPKAASNPPASAKRGR